MNIYKKPLRKTVGIYATISVAICFVIAIVGMYIFRGDLFNKENVFSVVLIVLMLCIAIIGVISSLKNYWYIELYEDKIVMCNYFYPSKTIGYSFSLIECVCIQKDWGNPVILDIITHCPKSKNTYIITLVDLSGVANTIKVLKSHSIKVDVSRMSNRFQKNVTQD